jgi:hypothetical protein
MVNFDSKSADNSNNNINPQYIRQTLSQDLNGESQLRVTTIPSPMSHPNKIDHKIWHITDRRNFHS